MNYGFTLCSGNKKTGPMPIVMAPKQTCPAKCPFKGFCYGIQWPIGLHWNKISEGKRGFSFEEAMAKVKELPRRLPWRYGDVGDLPGCGANIAPRQVELLVKANKGKKGFCFTHKPMTKPNQRLVRMLNAKSFTVNLSGEGPTKADKLLALGVGPVATVLVDQPEGWRRARTTKGTRIQRCPAEFTKTQCITCGGDKGPICTWRDRKFVVGFTPHGNVKKKIERIVRRNA
jgi:hypothetical protein